MRRRAIVPNRLGLVAALALFVWLCHRCVTTHGQASVPPPASRVDAPATMAGVESGAGPTSIEARRTIGDCVTASTSPAASHGAALPR